MNIKGKKIAFLGDSITEGYGATNRYGYVDYIKEYSGANCFNFGIAGTRIAKQKEFSLNNPLYDKDFCMRAEDLDGDFDYIVVFGGTNDFGHGDAPLGAFSDRTPDTFYGALHTLYNILLKKYSKSKIVVVTPIYRTAQGELIKPDLSLKSYVKAIKQVAEYYDLSVLDLFENDGCSVFDDSLLSDGLHPNNDGHRKIARFIIDFLENNF